MNVMSVILVRSLVIAVVISL